MILGIYGSGGLSREILDMVMGSYNNTWDKIVFISDFKKKHVISGIDVFNWEEFTKIYSTNDAKIVISVGEPKIRKELREIVTVGGYKLQTLIHPSSFTGTETHIGDGVVIQFGCFISCNVNVGDNALFQPHSSAGHDSIIGSDSVISSFVSISGACSIGDQVYIGMNVPVKEKINIGTESIIGMGSVVLRDIPENVIALGNPARAIKDNESGYVFTQR